VLFQSATEPSQLLAFYVSMEVLLKSFALEVSKRLYTSRWIKIPTGVKGCISSFILVDVLYFN